MKDRLRIMVPAILAGYDATAPNPTAARLRDLWLQFEPKSVAGVKAEQREKQEHVGTPVEVLKIIGKETGKVARQRVPEYIPLARLLWDDYGREGRIVAAHVLGPMELTDPAALVPVIMDLCRTCASWEDADQLAMNALEPIVRKYPDQWLDVMVPWLDDANLWVRRAGVTTVGRLPMKHAAYTARCVTLSERLLLDEETDVKRAVSFALRICARGDVVPVRDFLARHVPPQNPAATWVLCDVIRSMAAKLLPEFVPLLPRYEHWAADPALNSRDRRSIESAVKKLQKVKKDSCYFDKQDFSI
jgi:3-methyladenine DNA glycosylase AlkD